MDEKRNLLKLKRNKTQYQDWFFLDSTDFKNLKLVYAVNSRQIWRSTSKETQDIEQFYDIRIKFETKEKALAFHKEYWKENSEFGSEIKKHEINVKGIENFRVFKGADIVNQLVASYGLQMYCFIFVVDSYFVKFYISCKIELEPSVIQPYLDKVISKIKN